MKMNATNSTSARNFIPMANKYDRVVLLIDMDCFYCQVEEKLDPSLKNQPLAVVQYNAWKGGGIIAVNYSARAKGVTRQMRGDEAKEQCPEIKLVKVPNVREKADLTKYREAGKDVANVLQRFTSLLERASVDEAYLDITSAVNKRLQELNDGTFTLQPQELANTYAVGFNTIGDFVTAVTTSFIINPLADDDNFYRNYNENDICAVRHSNIRLLIGASIANEIRTAVKAETSYECSAGIAHNKILAKLACGINKPNKQTILSLDKIPELFETLPISKIKGLGAKFGEEVCERLGVRYLGQLLKFTEVELQRKFDDKNGTWLYNICRGIDLEAVTPRFYSKSIGCCKKFPGRNNITGVRTLQHWLNELANEINERLEKDICENNRRAKQMVVNFIQEFNGEEVSSSRSAPLLSYDTEMLAKTSLEILKANTKQFFRSGSESVLNNPIKFLGISVGKFETISNSQNNIQEMFAQQAVKKQKQKIYEEKVETATLTKNLGELNSETASDPKAGNETHENTLKQIPKEKKYQTVKSFFLNALKKEQPNEKENSLANDSNIDVVIEAKTSMEKLASNSSNQINLETVLPNELVTPSCDTGIDTNIKTSQKSFFARALRKKQEPIKKESAYGLTSKSPFDTVNLNENQKPNINDNSALNNLSTEKSPIPNNENDIDLDTNENEIQNITQNNNIDSGLKKVIKLNLEIMSNNFWGLDNVSKKVKRTYEQISDTEELNQTDYRSQYAEYASPEFTPEFLKLTTCSKCDAKIVNDPTSIQNHNDYHYAQELSKQQRQIFREEIRSKIKSPISSPKGFSSKKSKKVQLFNSSVIKRSNTDITKFLKSSSSSTLFSTLASDQNQTLESSTSNTEICDICKLPIKTEEILEHKDFHMAKDLQRKLNQLEVYTVEVGKKTSSIHSARKPTKSSMNMSSRHNNKVTAKPITQFFTQSNIF